MDRDYIFHNILQPLITLNHIQRFLGVLPDEFYWVESLAIEWGYLHKIKYPNIFLAKRRK